jgi:Flp pilus assembly protein TadD
MKEPTDHAAAFVDLPLTHEGDPQTRAVRSGSASPWECPPSEIIFARQALEQGCLAAAEVYLRRAIDREPGSSRAWSLMGVLRERSGECHSAFRCFRTALELDRHDHLALSGLRRYRDRFHRDFRDPAINPAAGGHPPASSSSGPPC